MRIYIGLAIIIFSIVLLASLSFLKEELNYHVLNTSFVNEAVTTNKQLTVEIQIPVEVQLEEVSISEIEIAKLTAVEFQLPPLFVQSIAEQDLKNWRSKEQAYMHCRTIRDLAICYYRNTWWAVALMYNRGQGIHTIEATDEQIQYATAVIDRYHELSGYWTGTVIRYTDDYGFF